MLEEIVMDKKTYDSIRDKEFRGRKVKTLVELSNGWCRIPPNTVCTIMKKYDGFALLSVPCVTCGVKVAITHVRCKEVNNAFTVNPGQPHAEPSSYQSHICHHDEDANIPCELISEWHSTFD